MKYDWLINKPHRGTVNDILWLVTYPLRNMNMACGSSDILSVLWIILKDRYHIFSYARDIRDVLCSVLGNCALKINVSTEWQLSLCNDISRGWWILQPYEIFIKGFSLHICSLFGPKNQSLKNNFIFKKAPPVPLVSLFPLTVHWCCIRKIFPAAFSADYSTIPL